MRALLILNQEKGQGSRIIVNVRTKALKEKVIFLLKENRDREAFDLLVKEAEVTFYLLPGQKAHIRPRPEITLIEDLL